MTHKYFPGSKDPENTLRHSPSLRRAIPPALEGPLQISAKENDASPLTEQGNQDKFNSCKAIDRQYLL